MTINVLLSTIILVSFIATIILAVGSYMAYKVRERRRPEPINGVSGDPMFFERFFPRRADVGVAEVHEGQA